MVPLVHSGKARLRAVPLIVVVKETHPAAGPAIAVAVVAHSALNNRTRSPGRDMNAVVAASGKHFVRPAAGDNRIPIVAGGDGIVARAQTEICRTLRPGEVLPFVAECQVAGQVLGGDVAVRKPDRLDAVVGVPPVFDGQHIRKPGKGLALLFNADLEVITRKPHHNLLTTQIPHDERVVARMVPFVHSGKARLRAVPLRVVVKEGVMTITF